jgi:hypothetical protein
MWAVGYLVIDHLVQKGPKRKIFKGMFKLKSP